jgi:hypothetical protein
MAPNKKYLSLEEAAALLGVKTDELIRMREKGDVRGFADRGTWKFKTEDVAECRRRRQPDSDPDMQILDDFGSSNEDDFGQRGTVIRKGSKPDSDSDVRMVSDNLSKKSPLSGSSAEVPVLGSDSDSDVRLTDLSKKIEPGSESDVTLILPNTPKKKSDSDSDVRLIDSSSALEDESDSDAKFIKTGSSVIGSDSDVRLSMDSDSDVRLSSITDSDSDVQLIGPKTTLQKNDSDSDVTLLSKGKRSSEPDDSSISLAPADSGIQLAGADSGIQLAGDSGIRLGGDSSGIRLGGDSSGIRLGASSGIRLGGDSGIRLTDDSGVQLKQPRDSGISLEGRDSNVRLADSGIVVGDDSGLDLEGSGKTFDLLQESSVTKKSAKGGSSKKLKAPRTEDDLAVTLPMDLDGDLGVTSPLLKSTDLDDESASDLDMFDPGATSELESIDDSQQNVVMFEDEDEDSSPPPKKRHQKTVEESIFEIDEIGDESVDELEVSDDDLSGEDEIDELAFDDDDDDLEESFSEGTSKLGFGSKKVSVAREVEWSAGFCSLLIASVLMLAAGTWVSADLLRTVWAGNEDSAIYSGFASQIGGILWK